MLKPFDPPFLLNAEKNYFGEKIKSFSENLFKNKLYGFIYAIIFNLYLINCFINKKNLLTIFFEILLFVLIRATITTNIFNAERK